MKPLDFTEVIDFIKLNKGFDDYAPVVKKGYLPSLSTVYRQAYSFIRRPRFPGDQTYDNGPLTIVHHEVDLPQETIDQQHQSFKDALGLYMNPRHLMPFMCSFFRGDFLSDPNFLKVSREELPMPPEWYKQEAAGKAFEDDNLILDVGKPGEARIGRIFFENRELAVAEKVCLSVPELRTSVLAFQAGFLAYLERLEDSLRSIQDDCRLTEKERNRGIEVVRRLVEQWSTTNFSSELLPPICLAYHARDPSLVQRPILQDFEKGFRLGIERGLFQSHYDQPCENPIVRFFMTGSFKRQQRHFRCPALRTIGTMAAKDLGAELCLRSDAPFPIGQMLWSIYKAIIQLPATESTCRPPVHEEMRPQRSEGNLQIKEMLKLKEG